MIALQCMCTTRADIASSSGRLKAAEKWPWYQLFAYVPNTPQYVGYQIFMCTFSIYFCYVLLCTSVYSILLCQQAAALYKFCHGAEKDASVHRNTVSYELPSLVKYLSSWYAQAGYKTALCSNYSMQLSNVSKAVRLV